ncbi:hypothetical protein [Marasmitruncus massiliensis]|jgi:hypothetical protein|uniref:hypothetical protein n=1 Tax=Marasmitruncus massiliensis TaxID=1944642 RepID=UPI0015E0BF49|nr:hypothetical protein [Marasmitruncus massiliensis]MBE6905753.1 hypothetical protein [Oscillospiraceae bacterium]
MMRWNSTKTYTEEDIMRMQQEAVSRVHEMQARAQNMAYYEYESRPAIGEHYDQPVIEAESRIVPVDQTSSPPPEVSAASAPTNDNQSHGLLSNLNLDSESLLILGLIYLLYNEKADNSLLMALGYLLL